jgi:hypothetical protein
MDRIYSLATSATRYLGTLPVLSSLPSVARVSTVAAAALVLLVAAFRTVKWALNHNISPTQQKASLNQLTFIKAIRPGTAKSALASVIPAPTYPETYTTTLRSKKGIRFMTQNTRPYEVVGPNKLGKWTDGVSITFSKDPSLPTNQYICTNDSTKSTMTVKCLNILDDPSVDGPGESIR